MSNKRIVSEETRKKISIALKGIKRSDEFKKKVSNAVKGRKLSEEAKKRMSQRLKGRKLSEEVKQKISLSKKGKVFTEEHKNNISKAKLGTKHTEETKKKISHFRLSNTHLFKRSLNNKLSAEYKRKISFTIYRNKRTVRVRVDNVCYLSLSEAGIQHNLSSAAVSHRCRSLNFYGWEFINEDRVINKTKRSENNVAHN